MSGIYIYQKINYTNQNENADPFGNKIMDYGMILFFCRPNFSVRSEQASNGIFFRSGFVKEHKTMCHINQHIERK